MRRCNRCWKLEPAVSFTERRHTVCNTCTERHRDGYQRLGRSVELDDRRELRVLWVPRSQTHKLGPIPSSTTAGFTCPTSCTLRGNGCYAEAGFGGYQWKRLSRGELGIDWLAFLAEVRALPAGQLWRHNLAGDLPGTVRHGRSYAASATACPTAPPSTAPSAPRWMRWRRARLERRRDL